MVQVFNVLRCCTCNIFQIHQVKKVKKWQCKVCGEKQSIKKIYSQGSGAECRKHVQRLNTIQGEYAELKRIDDIQTASPEEKQNEGSAYEENCGESRWDKFIEAQNSDDINQDNELWNESLKGIDNLVETQRMKRKHCDKTSFSHKQKKPKKHQGNDAVLENNQHLEFSSHGNNATKHESSIFKMCLGNDLQISPSINQGGRHFQRKYGQGSDGQYFQHDSCSSKKNCKRDTFHNFESEEFFSEKIPKQSKWSSYLTSCTTSHGGQQLNGQNAIGNSHSAETRNVCEADADVNRVQTDQADNGTTEILGSEHANVFHIQDILEDDWWIIK